MAPTLAVAAFYHPGQYRIALAGHEVDCRRKSDTPCRALAWRVSVRHTIARSRTPGTKCGGQKQWIDLSAVNEQAVEVDADGGER